MDLKRDFKQVILEAEDFPSLPGVTQKVLQMSMDENVSLQSIAQLIERDVSLSARILKIVNSSYYGFENEITNILSAITKIGTRGVRDIAITLALYNFFPKTYSDYYEQLFHRALLAAITANLIANFAKFQNKHEIFLAGLMQNIGMFVLLYYLPKEYIKILQEADNSCIDLNVVEIENFGFTNIFAGEVICSRWNLPESVKNAIRFRKDFDLNLKDTELESWEKKLLMATAAGDIAAEIYFGANKGRNIVRFKSLLIQIPLVEKGIANHILSTIPDLYKKATSGMLIGTNTNLAYTSVIREANLELEQNYKKHERLYREYCYLKKKLNGNQFNSGII